ncbi:9907_t:CDS:10 [Paraglomus brasilianum]|uniref:DNA replication licensing factor MCM5 n=1 Tax=Paraglomus brasilianum TaxID=144538 RepID=A0A9N9DET7_9GLOM|nr:9907_t:CDS:10 [Paraglomus brasilianum]
MSTIGWDSGQIYGSNLNSSRSRVDSLEELEDKFSDFVENYRVGAEFIYREQLRRNLHVQKYHLEIVLEDLINSHLQKGLEEKLVNRPRELLPLFETAAKKVARKILLEEREEDDSNSELPNELRNLQVILRCETDATMQMRHLDAHHISKLVRIRGIIISASSLSAKATQVQIKCKTCRHTKMLSVHSGFSGITLPRTCDSDRSEAGPKECGLDPFFIVHDKSNFVDQQILKLQEAPDLVPVGDLPRHMLLSCDRDLANLVIPGTRVAVLGTYDIFQNKSSKSTGVAIRNPYILVVGMQLDADSYGRGEKSFTPEEQEEFIAMSKQPHFYEMFANSIAPSIYGNTDIKKAVTCLLFGGSKKVLPDNMRLRGDINVLLLGDPGTAKSQLLKFVEKVAPVAVYTSGKGSSAAGLTASVIRDAGSREFHLEGGAMVLADGGVVCIDEFDKMREEDRVAIHEAMEQQTISIAKAGITTVLNSRTSVLAAANPIFGRYDDMKTPGENIDFQATILSRFDMIFIIKDEHEEDRDRTIARHVMLVHMNRANPQSAEGGEIDIEKMKKYIAYCRTKCAPRLSAAAAEKLSSHFVSIRSEVRRVEQDMRERSSIPITIRQLEAIVRISEALAKLTLSPIATEEHVDEAIRLFKRSTMDALQTGEVEGLTQPQVIFEVQNVTRDVRNRLPVGSSVSAATLLKELSKNYSDIIVRRALDILVRQETLQYKNSRKVIHRSGV